MYAKIFVGLMSWKNGKVVMTFSLAVGNDDVKVESVMGNKSRYTRLGLSPQKEGDFAFIDIDLTARSVL